MIVIVVHCRPSVKYTKMYIDRSKFQVYPDVRVHVEYAPWSNKSFYRAFNALFGKIGRAASEEVIISLIKSEYVPRLLFCLRVLSSK